MFSLESMLQTPIFDYYAPLGRHYRGLLSIPHSGENIPDIFTPYLSGDEQSYKEDVDYKVNELVDIKLLQEAGIAVLVARVHRICVDLNRAENNCVLFWKQNTQGRPLVIKDPSADETMFFIQTYHRPYFEILKAALKELEKIKANPVSMVDLHSMPSRPTEYHLKQNPNQKSHRPDFCLSDRKGLTCQKAFIEFFQNQLSKHQYEAALNDPYVGGYVTEYVNQFRTNNIQIEINRRLYMNELTKELIPDSASKIKSILTESLINGFMHFDS